MIGRVSESGLSRQLGRLALAGCLAAACRDASHVLGPTTAHLNFDVEPVNGIAGPPLLRVVVSARDGRNSIDPTFIGPITLRLSGGGGLLSGDTVASLSGGTATFSGLRIANAGASYTLVAIATDARLSDARSTPFGIAPPGQRIAFVGPGLFVMNADGSGFAALVQNTGAASVLYGRPAWSPDATRIVFEKDSSIYVVSADGTGLMQVAANGFDPAWLPDGRRIRFARAIAGGATEIVDVAADGSTISRVALWPYAFRRDPSAGILDWPSDGSFGSRLTWSPDGERVLFQRFVPDVIVTARDGYDSGTFMSLYVMNVDGSGLRALTDTSSREVQWGGSWSPDGRRVAFVERPQHGALPADTAGLSIIDPAGVSAPFVLVDRTKVYPDDISSVAWSADGRHLALVRYYGAVGLAFTDATAAGPVMPLTQIPLDMLWPNYSPVRFEDLAWSPR